LDQLILELKTVFSLFVEAVKVAQTIPLNLEDAEHIMLLIQFGVEKGTIDVRYDLSER
jgi:hypothetical protein